MQPWVLQPITPLVTLGQSSELSEQPRSPRVLSRGLGPPQEVGGAGDRTLSVPPQIQPGQRQFYLLCTLGLDIRSHFLKYIFAAKNKKSKTIAP